MYCSSCGLESVHELSYCNRCGANLISSASATEAVGPASRPAGLAWAIPLSILATVGVVLGGIAIVFAFVMELIRMGVPPDLMKLLAVLGFLTIITTVLFLSRLLFRLLNIYQQPGPVVQVVPAKKPASSAPSPSQIAAPREPGVSVTEQTTRAFEPSYRERRP